MIQELDSQGQECMVLMKSYVGRHRGREGKLEYTLCGAEYESVVHVLGEC